MTNLMTQSRWWLYDWIFDNLDQDGLKEFKCTVFDRWCWESGTTQDLFLLAAVEEELNRRENVSKRQFSFEFRGKTKHLLEDEEFVRTFDANYQRREDREAIDHSDADSQMDGGKPARLREGSGD
jgi:hypothetical protein